MVIWIFSDGNTCDGLLVDGEQALDDTMITATSLLYPYYKNEPWTSRIDYSASWIPSTSDNNPYVQV